jgi:3'-phosphoadenosine 5'-phosphosulfate sulfotransferase (PAPS reductase)/FAD synthetase
MTALTDRTIDSPWITTPAVPRPQPTTEPPAVEFDSITDVPPEMDRWVGFSGGRDSLAVTHYAMSYGLAQGVVYCDTGSGLAANLAYVRRVCDRHGWPLVIVPPRHSYEKPLLRYGAPGPDLHSMWFNLVKGDGWGTLQKHINGGLKLVTGVWRGESENRMKAVTEEVQREEGNFRGWFISPFFDAGGGELAEYIHRHGLKTNECYSSIGRSGDCYCLAYAGRDELTMELAKHYPDHYHWIMNRERRMQEYRGRLLRLEDEFPTVYEYAQDTLRTQNGTPYPMLDEVFRTHLPAHDTWARSLSRREAVLRAMQEHTCWLGHGGTSSKQLQQAAAQADNAQTSICEASCNARSVMGVLPEVEQATAEATRLAENSTQATLVTGTEQ